MVLDLYSELSTGVPSLGQDKVFHQHGQWSHGGAAISRQSGQIRSSGSAIFVDVSDTYLLCKERRRYRKQQTETSWV